MEQIRRPISLVSSTCIHSMSVAHKSKMEVSPGVAQTGARLALDDATQQSRNI